MSRRRSAAQHRAAALPSRCAAALLLVPAALLLLPTVGAGAATESSRVALAAQSTWTRSPGSFSITLGVTSTLPPGALGVRFTLYSALPNRLAFAVSTTNTELESEQCIATSALLPLGDLDGPSTQGTVRYAIRFAASPSTKGCAAPSASFSIGCPAVACSGGVYPLSVELRDRATNAIVGSFTTHVVVPPSTSGSQPLRVGLVLPLGAGTNIAPSGSSTVARSVGALTTEVRVLARSRDRLSVTLYPELLLALQRAGTPKAKALIRAIDALLAHDRAGARVETLTAPFANLDPSALAANGLGGDVAAEISRGRAAFAQHFGHPIGPAPFATPLPTNAKGLATLERACVSEIVVPEQSVSALAGSRLTPTAPVLVGSAVRCGEERQPPVAFVADTGLDAELNAHTRDPVLAGENFLADLAQIYFESPFASSLRAVVAVGEGELTPATLSVVLDGLHDDPILSTAQLTSLFSTVPPGSNGNLATGKLDGAARADAPSAEQVAVARTVERAVASTVPNNAALIGSLRDAILIAESAEVGASGRSAYLDAPRVALNKIGRQIAFTGSVRVTLTSRSGKIPITIRSNVTGPRPVLLVIHYTSSALLLPPHRSETLVLRSKDTDEVISVSTRTSGSSDLVVTLDSASGGFTLGRRVITVTSTAVSGVAIALSAIALVVLLAWWLRSILRTRRRRAGEAGGT